MQLIVDLAAAMGDTAEQFPSRIIIERHGSSVVVALDEEDASALGFEPCDLKCGPAFAELLLSLLRAASLFGQAEPADSKQEAPVHPA